MKIFPMGVTQEGGVARNILEINVNANDDIQLHRKHPVREADSQSRVAGETVGRNKDRQRKGGRNVGVKKTYGGRAPSPPTL